MFFITHPFSGKSNMCYDSQVASQAPLHPLFQTCVPLTISILVPFPKDLGFLECSLFNASFSFSLLFHFLSQTHYCPASIVNNQQN